MAKITQEDRVRFYETMNKENLTWEEFWERWDDSSVELMIFHGG